MILISLGTHVSVSLPKIKERENKHPDEINEVPVKSGNFNDLVITTFIVIALPDLVRDDQKIKNTDRHVQPMEARHHEENRSELWRTEGIGPRPYTLRNELRPLEYLHPNKGGTEQMQ